MYCDFVHFQSPFGFEVAAVTVAVDFAIQIMKNLNKYLNNNLSKKKLILLISMKLHLIKLPVAVIDVFVEVVFQENLLCLHSSMTTEAIETTLLFVAVVVAIQGLHESPKLMD